MKNACADPGCPNDVRSRGLCSKHYQRYKYRGTLEEMAPHVAVACTVCGAGLTEHHDYRRFLCSDACADEWRGRKYREKRDSEAGACDRCGESLVGRKRGSRFCSLACASASRNAGVAAATRANRKPCDYCGQPLPLGRHRFCSDGCKRAARRSETYGLSPDELVALLAQHDVCAICGTNEWGRKGPQVDHDHTTGRVRGVLCVKCNTMIGHANDDIERLRAAIAYLS